MKSVLITGGTGGVGSVVTKVLLDHDYAVLIPHRLSHDAENLYDEIPSHQRKHLTLIHADPLSENGVRDVFSEIDKIDNHLFGLVHLLGGIRTFNTIGDTLVEDWDYLVSLNVRSFFLFAREAMNRFRKDGIGRIVSIGAMAAIKPSATQSAYSVSKAGVIALTKILADEGRAIRVTANCIVPSVIATPANLEWGSEDEVKNWVTPDEIAKMILYLCSDDARSINGSVIQMLGKMSL